MGDTQLPPRRWAESTLPSNVSLYGPLCKPRGAPVMSGSGNERTGLPLLVESFPGLSAVVVQSFPKALRHQ
jgi:hypothetical protein